MGDDRRRDRRQPAEHLKARVRFADRRQLQRCYLKDISRGGIFLRTPKPGPLDSRIEVTLELPGNQLIKLNGTVVHRVGEDEVRPGQPAGIGVQFSDLTASVRRTLEGLIEELAGPADAASPAAPPAARPLPVRGPAEPAPGADFEERKTDPRGARKPATMALLPDAPIIEEGFEDQPPPDAPVAPAAYAAKPAPARPPTPLTGQPALARPGRPPTPAGVRAAGAGAGASRVLHDTLRRLLWRFAAADRLAGRDHYEVIGVERAASTLEIHAACEALRRAFDLEHPPEPHDADAVQQVAAVVSVIDDIEQCLCDPRRRAAYDRDAPAR